MIFTPHSLSFVLEDCFPFPAVFSQRTPSPIPTPPALKMKD